MVRVESVCTSSYSYFAFVGDLVGLKILGTHILVLNSPKVMYDLLEKRGGKYSGRPIFTVVGELMELDKASPSPHISREAHLCRAWL